MESKLIGKTIDNYLILELLGKGGMGVVYKARDIQLDKIVALKMMELGLSRDENFLKRFRAEAKALGKLETPHIVAVHALRETELGLLLVMEFVDGDTLAQMLRARGPLPQADALPIFHQILHALDHAHGAGVIHRDLKPNNIMINRLGTVKVMDFGLAKIQNPSEPATTTVTGGTLHYMSPEQIQGMSQVDRRSDLYSLGMSLYETLAGKTPFDANDTDFQIRKIIVEGKLPALERRNPAIPKELSKVVMKALAKTPGERYQTAAEMAEALTVFEKKTHAQATPASTTLSGRRPRWKTLTSASAAFLVLISIFVLREHLRLPSSPGETPAATLSLATQPSGATVFLNEDSVGVTPLELPVTQEGEITLRLHKADYFTLDTSIVKLKGRAETFSFVLQPAARLALTVMPPEARVMIDGNAIAPARLTSLQLTVGRHDIQISASGYQTQQEQLSLVHGVNPQRNYVLQKTAFGAELPNTPAPGTLDLKSDPAGAAILVNGRGFGETPTTAQLAAGPYKILLRHPGYEDYADSVTVSSGLKSEVFGRLRPRSGTLSVLVKPYGTIYIDGALERRDANTRYSKTLAAGSHRLAAVHPTLGKWQKDVTLAAGQETFIEIDFNKQATLRVAAFDESNKPVFASIYVDDTDTNEKAPGQLTLPIGLHTITVRHEGYRMLDAPKTILLEGNVPEPLRFTLQKIQ